MTHSESLFEMFCDTNRIAYERVRTDDGKTPDYRLHIKELTVYAEVKQIEPNPHERLTLIKPEEEWGESDLYDGLPGDRVRAKIKYAMQQLRRLSNYRYPAVLVLYDNVHLWPEIADDYAIRVAMYGVEMALITSNVAPEGGAEIIARWYGSRRKVSPNYNRTLSAVAVLKDDAADLRLDVFHNYHARNPLAPDSLRLPTVHHYALESSPLGGFPDWNRI